MTLTASPSPRRRAIRLTSILVTSIGVAACSAGGEDSAAGDSAASGAAFPAPGAATVALNPADSSLITVYKSPTCGCCAEWVDHMREHGFRVAVTDVADISRPKQTYKVPSDVGSCHTGVIGGYFVEGHVPA